MKKEIYIILFTVLGFLIHFLIMALIETWYIQSTMKDFSGAAFPVIASLWLAAGATFGFLDGKFFWQKIYVEKIRKENVFNWIRKKRQR